MPVESAPDFFNEFPKRLPVLTADAFVQRLCNNLQRRLIRSERSLRILDEVGRCVSPVVQIDLEDEAAVTRPQVLHFVAMLWINGDT